MIREIMNFEYEEVYKLIREDNARNYFVRLGFESGKPVYERIWGQWDEYERLTAVLLKRLSGNLQFFAGGEFDIDGFAALIKDMEFQTLISPRSYCDGFIDKQLFSSVKDGAFIAKLASTSAGAFETFPEVEVLKPEDLDEVVHLYEQVFTSFSSKSVMEKRLQSGRGRGVCIRQEGRLVSVVQSEFEEKNSALIVGVGTAADFQGRGLASECLKTICHQLGVEGKDLYLQYDNPDAGRIYERLGFKPIDQVRHYKK